MSNFILIAVCFLSGWLLKRTKVIPEGSHVSINTWILYVALPAAALHYLPKISWSNNLFLLILTPAICWIGAWLMTQVVATYFAFDRATRAGFLIVCGLGNTSFVGFPLISAYYGKEWLALASILDQANFVLLAVFASFVAMKNQPGNTVSLSVIVKKLLTFPAFFAIPAALILPRFVSFEPVDEFFAGVASTLSPLALFSVGIQFKLDDLKSIWKPVLAASVYKLILTPAIVLAIGTLLHIGGMTLKISVFEAAMGTMISAGILCDQFDLNPKLSNAIVFTTIMLSFVTSGIWYFILNS